MARRTTLALAAAAAASALPERAARGLYRPVPGVGYMLASCVFDVESDATLRIVDGAFEERRAGGELVRHRCERAGRPLVVASAAAALAASRGAAGTVRGAVGGAVAARALQLPPDYDGWLEYAAFKTAGGIAIFTGNFSVPPAPASAPDVGYFFPALQNIDWIPKVDPEPSAPFDIIQPVLQTPAEDGSAWSVRSWWVTLDVGAAASRELLLKAGDVIFGNMTQTSAASPAQWFIGSQLTSSGRSTNINVGGTDFGTRLDLQPWAYVTFECYGCTSCATEPSNNGTIAFSGMALAAPGGAPLTPTWLPNPKPSKSRVCGEGIAVNSPASVDIWTGAP